MAAASRRTTPESQFPDEQDPDELAGPNPLLCSEDEEELGSSQEGDAEGLMELGKGRKRPFEDWTTANGVRHTQNGSFRDLDRFFGDDISFKTRISVCRGYGTYLSSLVRAEEEAQGEKKRYVSRKSYSRK